MTLYNWMFVVFWTLLHLLQQSVAIGDFYVPSNNTTEEKLPLNFDTKRIRKRLKEPIDMYGSRYSDIYIYLDGLVGFSEDDRLHESCPYRPTIVTPEKFVAPYWLRNTKGDVRYFEETKQKNSSKIAYADELASEINAAFGTKTVRAEYITYAVFISWNDMVNTERSVRRGRNSFQMILVNAGGKTYTHFIYRVLASYNVNSLNGGPQQSECQEDAVIGINAGQDYRFDLSGFFFLRREWVVYFTNEKDYQRLGRYVFGMYKYINAQPLPPRLNCIGDMPDPFCKIAVWDSVKDAIDEEFCKYRSTGMYPYPLSCDHFVHCVRKRASVHRCRPGLHFNPILSVCVWKEHVECKLPSRVIITTRHNGTMAPPTPARHNNFCIQRPNGIYPDKVSCDHYISCSNTQTILRRCPASLYFRVTSDGNGYCDHQRNVKCKNGIRTILNLA